MLTHFPQAPNPPFPLQNPARSPTLRLRAPRGSRVPAALARAPARSGSLTCCCKGISESSLAPGEVGGRLERGPEAERSGGAGRGRAPWGGGDGRGRVAVLGARAPGPSQAWEPASRRKWVPPLPLQRPLPPPPPPQSQARPPRTCAKRHRRVPERRDRSWRRDGNPAAPALRRRGAGRGTGRGRKGQGERRVKGRPGAR